MNIFFSGIGGVGIGPLAEIALDAGYQASGSDTVEGTMTIRLRERGIAISIGQDGSFLQSCQDEAPIDWFVHTAALPEDHPERLLASQLGIKIAKRDELLAYIISQKGLSLIAIAGTHGKTTTTGMLIWTLQQINIPISYSVGTTLQFGPSGKFDPKSKYFIYECDEFDRNFLHFTPHLSLITSIDYDHPDTYPTEAMYLEAFAQFINQSDHTVMWSDDYRLVSIDDSKLWMLQQNETLPMKLSGEHNRRNATLVDKAIEYLALGTSQDITHVLETFPGTDRRFERLADHLYSDYGHHPVEIAATLQLAREISDRVVLIYQPHQNIRQHEIRNDYTNCFELAEEIYWLPTYLSREDPALQILSPDELASHVTNRDSVHIADTNEDLWQIIQSARISGALVLGMGAGTIDEWLRTKLTS
jgi:UDP-N-acetylmuramate--alanine ligase